MISHDYMNHVSVQYSVSKILDVIHTVHYSNDFHYTVLFFFFFSFLFSTKGSKSDANKACASLTANVQQVNKEKQTGEKRKRKANKKLFTNYVTDESEPLTGELSWCFLQLLFLVNRKPSSVHFQTLLFCALVATCRPKQTPIYSLPAYLSKAPSFTLWFDELCFTTFIKKIALASINRARVKWVYKTKWGDTRAKTKGKEQFMPKRFVY